MSTLIKEAATATRTGPGRILLTLITPGEGASGTYSPEVLAEAAADKVFPRGTQSHINHDTPLERMERPEGNLRNLVGVLLEDAYVDDEGALVAEALISSAWRDFIEEFKEFIGSSIVASAEITESKSGRIVEKLHPSPFNRVDLVTVAGRGGKISEVLEAARVVAARSIVSEATSNDTREWLQAAVRADKDRWAWVRDFDDTNVWFEADGDDDTMRTYEQGYTLSGNTAALTGEPIEVRIETKYVPITAAPAAESKTTPPVPAGETKNQEEATMATIDDKELADLREAASRATTAEAELATERAARAEEAKTARKTNAESIVKEAFGADAPAFFLTSAALLAESAEFDPEKLRTDATEAAAKIAVDQGAGTPRGLGETAKVTESGKTITSESIVSALHGKAA
ncbi:hypothetical protein DQ353_00245 [Arthrobacter sp. AQ5-05]|uniref:hypothetical protein n=1 Tax=Arthrobacter sp. AQ5-05 TaxID=2184581 RepID=UPI000DCD2E7A|nr:hypothetical protein [Arthrobacter sp. AQ5-05]RAX50868.1 hypothetical protein DQ353_00245 [Arthrobacter sp. AQ5-05]